MGGTSRFNATIETCTRLVQEAACEDAVAAYVDVARTSLTEGDRTG